VATVPVFQWNVHERTIDANCMKGVDVVVHLAGANLNEKRWTPAFKREIIDSRVESARLLEIVISQSEVKPKAIVRSVVLLSWFLSLRNRM
jgi:NAD dependent epimerase/dehydratase family enzyme